MLSGINNGVLVEMTSFLWTLYLTQDTTGSGTIKPWTVSEHATCWVSPLVTRPAWMAMRSRAQLSVRFRAIQGGGQHMSGCKFSMYLSQQAHPIELKRYLSQLLHDSPGALVEWGSGVYALMSHHSTNVQLETGKSRGPNSQNIFQWRFEAHTDQRNHCFEEILTRALAKGGWVLQGKWQATQWMTGKLRARNRSCCFVKQIFYQFFFTQSALFIRMKLW